MGRVTLDIDDETLARAATVAEARHVSVEAVLADLLAGALWEGLPELHSPSHRRLMASLDRPDEAVSPDRERERATTYAENRRRLVELIDGTTGDMGIQRWDRASLYER